MARRKRPETESSEQLEIHRVFEVISNHATRSEKTSWERKRKNMDTLMKQLRPIEDEITVLVGKKTPLIDRITILRQEMVDDCIHPFDMLVYEGTHCICKFCNRKLNAPK